MRIGPTIDSSDAHILSGEPHAAQTEEDFAVRHLNDTTSPEGAKNAGTGPNAQLYGGDGSAVECPPQRLRALDSCTAHAIPNRLAADSILTAAQRVRVPSEVVKQESLGLLPTHVNREAGQVMRSNLPVSRVSGVRSRPSHAHPCQHASIARPPCEIRISLCCSHDCESIPHARARPACTAPPLFSRMHLWQGS